jgi:hypothetical protein
MSDRLHDGGPCACFCLYIMGETHVFVDCLYTLGKTHVCVCLFLCFRLGQGPFSRWLKKVPIAMLGRVSHARWLEQVTRNRRCFVLVILIGENPRVCLFVYTQWGKPTSLLFCLYSMGKTQEFVVLFILNGGNPRVCFSCLHSMWEAHEVGLVVYTLWGKPMCLF